MRMMKTSMTMNGEMNPHEVTMYFVLGSSQGQRYIDMILWQRVCVVSSIVWLHACMDAWMCISSPCRPMLMVLLLS